MVSRLKIHKLAKKFPKMSAAEYDALVEDIRENGQKEPICLFQGMILDGRHRYFACQELNLEPETKDFEGNYEQAQRFSVSVNLQRRHLSKSQQAMYLVRAGLISTSAPRGKRRAYGRGENAIRSIAERYGVSHVSLYKAAYVYEHDKTLAGKVIEGNLSVAKAESLIRAKDADRSLPRSQWDAPRARRELPPPSHPEPEDLPSRLVPLAELARHIAHARHALQQAMCSLPARREGRARPVQDVTSQAAEIRGELEALELRLADLQMTAMCETCQGRGCDDCEDRGWISAWQSDRSN